jgi:hypothetical protein
VPCLALTVFGGIPTAVVAVAVGKTQLLAIAAVAIVVLVAGALVNSYRGPLEAEALAPGFETPFGNTGRIMVVLWIVTGPLLAIGPMIILADGAISAERPGATATSAILSLALAAWLGSIAARRARRLRRS